MVAEIGYGLERMPDGRRKDQLQMAATEIFGSFREFVLPFDGKAASCYARIVSHRERIGQPLEGFDAQIAAICLARGAALATRNVEDFEETGIRVTDPWSLR